MDVILRLACGGKWYDYEIFIQYFSAEHPSICTRKQITDTEKKLDVTSMTAFLL